ncbi:MAG: hypothetical protein R3266_09765, partial [Gemmatimonadota bacterium]|nr:hypothetical protein [Gemmatimonadota bacterium]
MSAVRIAIFNEAGSRVGARRHGSWTDSSGTYDIPIREPGNYYVKVTPHEWIWPTFVPELYDD